MTNELQKLIEGNEKFVQTAQYAGDVSTEKRLKTQTEGQFPYAVIITCADSRVIPEVIFNAGLGELFVIRVAGNVVGEYELASVEYAVEHLGTKLVVVLGHTDCGAVASALGGHVEGRVKSITNRILHSANGETQPQNVVKMNVLSEVNLLRTILCDIDGLSVVGGIYLLESGKVEIL